MNQINLLRPTLKPLLGWHGARLSFLALFLIALLRVKTINLVELATGFRTQVKIDSNYKRLQRFFKDFNLDYVAIGFASGGAAHLNSFQVLVCPVAERNRQNYCHLNRNSSALGTQ